MTLPRNIILAGFMGTGKTSVGRALAQRLDWKLVDTDQMVEQRAGCSISEIFARQGEAAFREMESQTALEAQSLERHVISTGGGMALREVNREALARAGALVLLTAAPETIYERVRHSTHRPLLKKPDPLAEIKRLLTERAAAYGAIPLSVATDGKKISEIVEEIIRAVETE